MTAHGDETLARTSGGLFWALVPVGLLTASVVGLGTMASIATRDPGFSLEKDYYQRAVHWDREQAERAENARLGYRIGLEVARHDGRTEVLARIVDRNGAPVLGAAVTAEAFANARALDRRPLTFVAERDGTYRAPLDHARHGLWEFRLTVLSEGVRFTDSVRADVPGSVAP